MTARRFAARPGSVSFEAIGFAGPCRTICAVALKWPVGEGAGADLVVSPATAAFTPAWTLGSGEPGQTFTVAADAAAEREERGKPAEDSRPSDRHRRRCATWPMATIPMD